MSTCCAKFIEAHTQTEMFVYFVTDIVTKSDENRRRALTALIDINQNGPEEQERLERQLRQGDVATNQLRRYSQLILQTMISRAVDNFLVYVSDLLSTVFRTRPEMLRSNEQVLLEFVLKHDSMDELIEALAERRVERLAYTGMSKLAADLKDTIGFSLFESSKDLARAVRIVEARNLIVHNRAIVNRTYLRRVVDAREALGEPLVFDVNTVFDDVEYLAKMAVLADVRATEKWGLELVPYRREASEDSSARSSASAVQRSSD